jgi:Peptidase A4 family
MARRWCLPVMILAALAGPVLAVAPASALSARGAGVAHPVRPGTPMRPAGLAALADHRRSRRTVSGNWSGYAAAGGRGAFRSVSASWTEPTARCPSAGSARYASFWAGLDGYSSRSVEQTGTDADCHGRAARYYGWYEMYPALPVRFRTTVRPGDRLSASVTFSGARTYTLVLRDRTRGWQHIITASRAGLDRSSAEVITEAPSSRNGVVPLADFGTVRFTGARANGTSLRRLSPVKVIMAGRKGRQKDTTSVLSRAGAFHDTWLRSG